MTNANTVTFFDRYMGFVDRVEDAIGEGPTRAIRIVGGSLLALVGVVGGAAGAVFGISEMAIGNVAGGFATVVASVGIGYAAMRFGLAEAYHAGLGY